VLLALYWNRQFTRKDTTGRPGRLTRFRAAAAHARKIIASKYIRRSRWRQSLAKPRVKAK
jgi:hypothetical protein